MSNWRLDLFAALDDAQGMKHVLHAATNAIRPFGMETCGWRSTLPNVVQNRYTTLHSSDDHFIRRERDGHYDQAPVPRHCARSMEPICWQGTTTESLFMQAPHLWEEYQSCGHYGGWAQSLITGDGHFSMLYMDSPHVLMPEDLLQIDVNLRWITAAVLCRMQEIQYTEPVELTIGERDILRWSCEGLSVVQMATRSATPKCMINLRLHSAMQKLGASTQKAAVARAVFLGILF